MVFRRSCHTSDSLICLFKKMHGRGIYKWVNMSQTDRAVNLTFFGMTDCGPAHVHVRKIQYHFLSFQTDFSFK